MLARPDGVIFITANDPVKGSQVWCIKDGRTRLLDTGGLKFATGLAYRSDRWLLAVADGNSKWAYSFQINDDGSLTNKERFFELLVNNCDDDAGTGSVCYAQDGQVLVRDARGHPDLCAARSPPGGVARTGPQPRRRSGAGRTNDEHTVRLLRNQDLETEREAPCHRSLLAPNSREDRAALTSGQRGVTAPLALQRKRGDDFQKCPAIRRKEQIYSVTGSN